MIILAMLSAAALAAPHWDSAGWGGGGFFWSALIDPRGNGVMYLGGDVAGIYKSVDHGMHWRFANQGLNNYGVYSLAQCASHPDTIYAMTDNGIARSDDGGGSWHPLPRTFRGELNLSAKRGDSVRTLAVHPANPLVVLAGGPAGKLHATSDGGETWREIIYGRTVDGAVATVAIAGGNPSFLLVAHRGQGIFASHDDGGTWANSFNRPGAFTVAFAPSAPNLCYAGFEDGKVFRSADGGIHWVDSGAELPVNLAVREIVVDPRSANSLVAIGSANWAGSFFRSTDGGAHWAVTRPTLKIDPAGNPTLPDDLGSRDLSTPTNLCLNPRNPDEVFISCNWRNAYSADGGRTWEERSRGADISVVTDIRFAGGRVLATAMDEGLFETADQGTTWRQVFPLKWIDELSGHHWRVRAWQDGDRTRMLSTVSPWNGKYPNTVITSEDGGKTFASSSGGLPTCVPTKNTMWGRAYPRALAQDPKTPSLIYLGMDGDPDPKDPGCSGGFFRSTDGGKTWIKPKSQPGSRRIFYGLATDPMKSGRVYWGACGDGGGVYRSDDRGEQWKKIFDREPWIFNVHVTATGRVLAAGTRLWASDDAGKTWNALTSFSDGCTIVGVESDPGNDRRLWISRVTWDGNARGGVHRSTDGGKTWEEITGDLPYVKPLILRFDPATNSLWAGGSGIFKLAQ